MKPGRPLIDQHPPRGLRSDFRDELSRPLNRPSMCGVAYKQPYDELLLWLHACIYRPTVFSMRECVRCASIKELT